DRERARAIALIFDPAHEVLVRAQPARLRYRRGPALDDDRDRAEADYLVEPDLDRFVGRDALIVDPDPVRALGIHDLQHAVEVPPRVVARYRGLVDPELATGRTADDNAADARQRFRRNYAIANHHQEQLIARARDDGGNRGVLCHRCDYGFSGRLTEWGTVPID